MSNPADVERICLAALEQQGEQRAAFIADACQGDDALRQEVESLLANATPAEGFLEHPAGEGSAALAGLSGLSAGQRLGPYHILDKLGVGGMGEVYRARDTQLGREVAIKILPVIFAMDPERLARFEREARVLASLNHPHIAAIYGIETGPATATAGASVRALVLELVEGVTLAERIARGPVPVAEALAIARQIADALDVAHEKGIVHRDLKPANVKITPDGVVKVLDFGLAKAGRDAAARDLTLSPTLSIGGTHHGVILGTAPYMSPEQARGFPVDKRTDIWAFGCVLYEMLTGRAPFRGHTVSDVIAAILHGEPDWSALPDSTPPIVRRLLTRCFEKNSKSRLRDVGDVRIELEDALTHLAEVSPASRPPRRLPWAAVGAFATFMLVSGAAMAWWLGATFDRGLPVSSSIRSIAVLPMQNLSGDPNEEYFSDGMTEQLISNLSQVHALRVTSRTSVMRYKGSDVQVPDIGRELGVDAVISASMRRAGGRIRVTAQLIHAASDAHLWAKDFDRDFSDVLTLQAEIAEAIVREIRAQVTPDEARRIANIRTISPEAYDAFMMGRYHLWQGNRESWKLAVAELEQAIRLQPDYAPAHATLASALATGLNLAYTRSEGARRAAVRKAIDLDPSLAEAHAALAEQKFDDWEWQGAIDAWEKALSLNPDSIGACGCYGNALAAFSRFDQAIGVVEQGVAANPLAHDMRFNYAFVLYMMRRYADAERQLLRTLELEPRYVQARIILAEVYERMGRRDNALAQVDRPELQGSAALGAIYAQMGRHDDALKVLARIDGSTSPFHVANVYFALGDLDRGFEWMTKAVERRQGLVRWLNVSPKFDPVRSDPRFAALVARLKLPAGK